MKRGRRVPVCVPRGLGFDHARMGVVLRGRGRAERSASRSSGRSVGIEESSSGKGKVKNDARDCQPLAAMAVTKHGASRTLGID